MFEETIPHQKLPRPGLGLLQLVLLAWLLLLLLLLLLMLLLLLLQCLLLPCLLLYFYFYCCLVLSSGGDISKQKTFFQKRCFFLDHESPLHFEESFPGVVFIGVFVPR